MYMILFLLERGGLTSGRVELTPGRALAGCPLGDTDPAGYHANMTSRTIDIKALFQLYDCKPGRGARTFRRNALQCLSKTDARGWSLADTLLRVDEGAVLRGEDFLTGVAVPGTPQVPTVGPQAAEARALRSKRVKDSAAAILMHIDDDAMKEILSVAPYAQNGPEMFDEIMERCLVPMSSLEAQESRAKVLSLSVTHDVGFHANTILDLMKAARVENIQLMATGHAVNDNEMGEMLLRAIAEAHPFLAESALEELNAPPGLPLLAVGLRRFQLAPPALAPPGALPTRDLRGLVLFYDQKWRNAIEAGHIECRKAKPRTEVARALSTAPSDPTPQQSLALVRAAGIVFPVNTVTTSLWDTLPESDLLRSLDVYENGTETEACEIVMAVDGGGTTVFELICRNCRGAGHVARNCPSPLMFRGIDQHISLLEIERARVDDPRTGGIPGGKRATLRGQVPGHTRQIPRRFSSDARLPSRNNTFRRYLPSDHRINATATTSWLDTVEAPRGEDSSEVRDGRNSTAVQSGRVEHNPVAAYRARMIEVREESPPVVEGVRGAVLVEESLSPQADTRATDPSTGVEWAIWILGLLWLAALTCPARKPGNHAEVGEPAWMAAETREDAMPAVGTAGMARLIVVAAAVLGCVLVCILGICFGACPRQAQRSRVRPEGMDLVLDPAELCSAEGSGEVLDCRNAIARAVERANKVSVGNMSGDIAICFDSGATTLVLPMEDVGLADVITNSKPNVTVEVADGYRLRAGAIGNINSNASSASIVIDSFRPGEEGGKKHISAPKLTRAVFTKGLKRNTRLLGVTQARELDGILTYFNSDNLAGLSDCVRFPDGCYAHFRPDGRNELHFRCATDADRAVLAARQHARRAIAQRSRVSSLGGRTALGIHAALAHAAPRRIRESNISMGGVNLADVDFDLRTGECTGCRLGRGKPLPFRKSEAPSKGIVVSPAVRLPRQPSTTNYRFFGARVDTDMCTSMPPSFPHQFTVFTNFVDRHTAEFFLYLQVSKSGAEIASALTDFEARTKHRLLEGKVWQWSTDNDLAFSSNEARVIADQLITVHTQAAAGEKNAHPVSERNIGVIRQAILAMRFYPTHYGYEAAPECLWSWAAAQTEQILYYLQTEAHNPPVSPYYFSHPNAPTADLSWAWPMFCDCTVQLMEVDVSGKMGSRAADGVHLGFDGKRGCHFVFIPSTNRLGSFTVTHWRPEEFKQCQGILADTPVNYREDGGGDLRMGPVTATRIPPRRRPTSHRARAVSDEDAAVLAENAEHIIRGVKELEEEGVEALDADAIVEMQEEYSANLAWADGPPVECGRSVEVVVNSPTKQASDAIKTSGITDIKTVDEAMASQWWPLFETAMAEEIAGKVSNEAWEVVPRPEGRSVMKSRWVFDVRLNSDGSIRKVKVRFVGCGYSQVPGRDFDNVYAATPPAFTLRYFFSVVALEGLITDQIDAVKAFTQARVDKELFCEMPDGFVVPGHVLRLKKALEGIKQAAALWFEKNSWAWGKCGLAAKLSDPNLYSHPKLRVLVAVFADDCGAGYRPEERAEWLKIRQEYGKLINIDSPGPDTTVPISLFVGLDVDADPRNGVVVISQRSYVAKLRKKYQNKVTMNEMPTPTSKAKREAFETMEKGDEDSVFKRQEFLEGLGEIGWVALMTMPELAGYHSMLASHMQYPTRQAHEAMMYILGYIINNGDSNPIIYGGQLKTPPGLSAKPPNFAEAGGLYATHDSSWGKRPRPQAGHAVFRANAAIHWSSSPLKVVCTSTAESETAEASRATKSVTFARMLTDDAGRPAMGPTGIIGDNSASYQLIQKAGSSQLTRYFERATVHVKYAVAKQIVKPYLVPTKYMSADVFTKAVDEETFFFCRHTLHNTEPDTYPTRKVKRLVSAMKAATSRV